MAGGLPREERCGLTGYSPPAEGMILAPPGVILMRHETPPPPAIDTIRYSMVPL